MQAYARPLARLVAEFERLPGIGSKTAQRLALHVLRGSVEDARRFAEALVEVKEKIGTCPVCHNFTDRPVCELCTDPRRDAHLLCVVAEPRDLIALEKTGEFRGRYHVLGGVLAPMDGVGPDQLRIRELIARVEPGEIREIVLATNPTVEGDATAVYLSRLLRPLGPKVTRIAHGVPVGGDIDYADQATLIQAFEGRREL
ncbi:MAG: recombination mediator RecR [Armatimonadota bacterium]